MKYLLLFFLFCAVFLFLVLETSKKPVSVDRGIYYWKNNSYSLTEQEKNTLKSAAIRKLYVKFFELNPNELFKVIPVAKTDLTVWNNELTYWDTIKVNQQTSIQQRETEVIPVIFVQNEVFKGLNDADLDSLVSNTFFLIRKYYSERIRYNTDFNEIQFDCDWTATTKASYFSFLKKMKSYSHKTISCTLRLYPYKYQTKMGVPPVDKATLMCYNLTNPLIDGRHNSILNINELSEYLTVKHYPIHLDAVLPYFSWALIYQDKEFRGIENNIAPDFFDHAIQKNALWWEVQSDVTLGSHFLRQGDQVKLEQVEDKELNRCITLLRNNVDFDKHITVSFFHLDENNFKPNTHENLASFYTAFTR